MADNRQPQILSQLIARGLAGIGARLFFTRQGALSTGAYHSLNVSGAVGDRRESVAGNLRKWLAQGKNG